MNFFRLVRTISTKLLGHRMTKVLIGIYFSWTRKVIPYETKSWWDTSFYKGDISDSSTISSGKSIMSTKYHYNSVENLILEDLINSRINCSSLSVLDIGSGAGHWIDFWDSLGSSPITGVDISYKVVQFLQSKYHNSKNVSIYSGLVSDHLRRNTTKYDIVNAIGVMFHIVDDHEWKDTIKMISNRMNPGGRIYVGGLFWMINGLDVQIDDNNLSNKRVRSKTRWAKCLKEFGFKSVKVIYNQSSKRIIDTLPENNILVASK